MSLASRSWRTAFLTLRDETLASPPRSTVLHHLDRLIFSQSDSLIAAASDLPPHEVTSDLMLLVELVRGISNAQGIEDEDFVTFTKLSHLIHGVGHYIQVNSTSWAHVFDLFKRIVPTVLDEGKTKSVSVGNDALLKAIKQCLQSIRTLFALYQAAASLSENGQLLTFLLQVVGCFQGESVYYSHLSDSHRGPIYNGVSEVLTVTFIMIGEIYSRTGSSLPVDIWQSTVEVLRKVVDSLTSKGLLVEDDYLAKFYIELLHCLHLVLAEPRGSLTGHVPGFVAALRIFLRYGLTNKSCVVNQSVNPKNAVGSTNKTPHAALSSKSRNGPYRPPHLRKKIVETMQNKDEDSLVAPEYESSSVSFTLSDSDCSDNDGSVTDNCSVHFVKARLAAILCIQDLCRADPKFFTTQWTMLLPSSDVLQHRQYETTLMSCLLFDPNLKVRIAAGSAIMVMLDGPASVSLQVAEFRGPSKCGSFTALSISLGHILMQLHAGILYLIKHESRSRLLALSFKILTLLTSSTPYSRMSEDLLSTVISSVKSRIDDDFAFQSDRSSLLVAAVNCLTLALSVSPSSTHVNNMLLMEVSTGSVEGQQKSGVLYALFRYSEQFSSPSVSLEAFQALKALAHNYPNVIALCWDQISSIVQGVLSPEVPLRSRRGNFDHTAAAIKERVMAAAIKVLDESLRAISGFKGTEDISNDKFLDSPFTSDYVKTKAISSAPSYSSEGHASSKDESESCLLASECWFEATVKHMPRTVRHSSAMVRAASITCFAGMTSSVFLLLPKDKQEFIMSSSIEACLGDEVPSVRSAACRAIGVIGCFPQIYQSSDILERFIHAVERNTCDSLVSVRITASWALANICDSLGHSMNAQHPGIYSIESRKSSQFISLLVDTALRLAKDNDKVKANAVRALGNLSRFVQFTSQSPVNGDPKNCILNKLEQSDAKSSKDDIRKRSGSFTSSSSGNSDWLQQMVQAFLSCVATGNVKVQWNVCHALSNLFFNKTLKLQDMDWSSSVFSILLLLLRDSSNFKIKIQAAAALAVPETIDDYGRSYCDVVKGVGHIVENLKSDQISAPSNFKYWIALEKQLTSTMLHLLGLAARCDHRALQDFLTKKASFLEVWIKNLCTSLDDTSNSVDEAKRAVIVDQKRDVILRTIKSLIEVYESCNHHAIAQRFDRLASSLL